MKEIIGKLKDTNLGMTQEVFLFSREELRVKNNNNNNSEFSNFIRKSHPRTIRNREPTQRDH